MADAPLPAETVYCKCGFTDPDGSYVPGESCLIHPATEVVDILRVLLDFIDREGPPAKEWKAITALCERGRLAIANAESRS